MLTEPDAVRLLCFGDSNTHGTPRDGLHLTLDSHESLARRVADMAHGTRTPPIA